MATKKAEKTTEITIPVLRRGHVKLRIVGTTPLFQNRMSNKVKQTLLVGGRKKTRAERLEIKHDPLQEYLDSAEILQDGPTALGLRVTAVNSPKAPFTESSTAVKGASSTRMRPLSTGVRSQWSPSSSRHNTEANSFTKGLRLIGAPS